MSEQDAQLMKSRRFLPLFLTQFLGAFNDNLFKNAMVILILFRLGTDQILSAELLVTVAAGIFILPFFLFSATAGQLADKFDKARVIRAVKAAEILCMSLAAAAFWIGNAYLLLAVLFLMGAQSAFFGPLKYGILPDHLPEHRLVGANALIEAGTFAAILLGTIAGGLLILGDHGIFVVSVAVIAVALAGWVGSLWIPSAPGREPGLEINWNVLSETGVMLRHAASNRAVLYAILGISWFWLLGSVFLAQFPAFAKNVIAGDEEVITLFLVMFSVGIGIGSLLCDRLLSGEISTRLVPLGALGMTLFTADLYIASAGFEPIAEAGALALLQHPSGWRVLLDLLLAAMSGGLFVVPLYAVVQSRSSPDHRARTIASNNVVNALFMVGGSLATAGLLAAGLGVRDLFLVLALANVPVVLLAIWSARRTLYRALAVGLLKLVYRVRVEGLEHLRSLTSPAVIMVNHVSFLDGVLLAAFFPGRLTFAVDSHIATRWWVRPFLSLVQAFPLNPADPMAIKSLIRAVQGGKSCVIFPEGRITVTGALMKVYEGPGMIADKADVPVIPVRIDGAQYTHFSRLRGVVRRRWFPRITITVQAPQCLEVPMGTKGRARRQAIGNRLYQVMSDLVFETDLKRPRTLFDALQEARRIHGGRALVIDDITNKPLSYNRFLLGALILGRRISGFTEKGEMVGVMLPTSTGAGLAFFALQAFDRVPAMLNFTAGPAALSSAIATAEIRTVLTSRRFIEAGRLEDLVARVEEQARVVYLEDLRGQVTIGDKLWGLAMRLVDARPCRGQPEDPAVVLFTSGSEGLPKGVVLSHRNLLANFHQLSARLDFNPTDGVFNALPLFHSFGLTGGLLLPLLSGTRSFQYPSPLHYRVVPELIYATNATILFGTDTFLAGYARVAHPYDFYSLRLVFAGAEKLRDTTRQAWFDKFGIRILEGYGSTECAPVLAANTPMHYRAGSVGRLLPGIDHRLEPVPGIATGGSLQVSGPNVMLGYLRAEAPGEIEPPAGGWYDTGDIVALDEDGYLTIQGRAKRFAKIAGEMVSLAAVEQVVERVWSDQPHAVVSLPDPRRGEQLVLLTEADSVTRQALADAVREAGLPELAVPKTVLTVPRIPLLGSGKTDYTAARALAEEAALGGKAA